MTQTWLLPLDGSDVSLRAVTWALAQTATLKEAPILHLLNVQPALPRDIGRFIDADTIRDFHRETGMAALAAAQAQCAAAGLKAEFHVLVGEAAPTIVDFATTHGCSQIVIGTHGHSGLAGTLLGSVAMRVVHQSRVPVLLVR